jgi:hypothetical protein
MFSQNEDIDFEALRWRDTTMIKIVNIEEYLYLDRTSKRSDIYRRFYIIQGQYADIKHKYYQKSIVIVSVDTISLKREYKHKHLFHIIESQKGEKLQINEIYLMHLYLWDYFPRIGDFMSEYYTVEGVRLLKSICESQPTGAIELKGLFYNKKE